MVSKGLAFGVEMFGLLSPVIGDHWYVLPPEAFNCMLEPVQISLSMPASIIGSGFTNTVTVSVLVQPLRSSTVTIWQGRILLIWSIIDVTVVVFPQLVGPVARIIPSWASAIL